MAENDDTEPTDGGGKLAGMLGGSKGPKSKKDKDRDQKILIVVGVVSVILTYAIYRSSKKAASANTANSVPTVPSGSPGQVAGGSDTSSASTDSLLGQLQQNQTAQGEQLSAQLTSQNAANVSAQQGFAKLLASLQSEINQIQASPRQPAASGKTGPIDSSAYPLIEPGGTKVSLLGKITGAGGQFTGLNVNQGAPVYAKVGSNWEQNFNAAKLPIGTELATLPQFQGDITSKSVTEKLT